MTRGGVEQVAQRIPGALGFCFVSLPVYTADGAGAVVYLEGWSHGLAGEGRFYYLTRVKDRWGIKQVLGGWLS
jgi:hypothetical protein